MIAPARLAAYEVLRAVSRGASDLSGALAQVRSRLADERDRALAGEIATGTLRWQGAFDHIIATFAKRPITKLDPEVLDILRLTAFQLAATRSHSRICLRERCRCAHGQGRKTKRGWSGQCGSPTNQPRARPSAAASTSQPAGRESRGDFHTGVSGDDAVASAMAGREVARSVRIRRR